MIYVLLRMKEYNEINTREGISFSCPREQQYLPLPHERVIKTSCNEFNIWPKSIFYFRLNAKRIQELCNWIEAYTYFTDALKRLSRLTSVSHVFGNNGTTSLRG